MNYSYYKTRFGDDKKTRCVCAFYYPLSKYNKLFKLYKKNIFHK